MTDMLERLRAYQSKYGSLKGEAYRAHTLELEKNPALHREVDELSRYFLNKSVSRCGFCLIEADLALRRITEQQMKNVAHPDYELRAGTLLHDPINKEFSKILTPRNITEDLCLYHIAFNKNALSYFTRVPEDLNDRLEKFMSRYGKEMPDKDVEIKKRQAQVLSKQIDSVKAELEELNKKQIELNAKLDEYSKAMEAIHAILDSASAEEKPEEKTEEKTEEKLADIDTEVKEFIDAGMDLEAIKEAYADSQMSAGEIEETYNRVVNPVSETPKKGAKKGGSK
nr:MAG: hypothetical protein [Bacteriophage sp.]